MANTGRRVEVEEDSELEEPGHRHHGMGQRRTTEGVIAKSDYINC